MDKRLLVPVAGIALLAAVVSALLITRWSATNTVVRKQALATVTLTEKDDGTTKLVSTRTAIAVELRGVANFRWTVPSTSDNRVVQENGGSQGSDGSATARFLAVAPGRAVLSATDNPNCFPICALPPASGWAVTIIVS